MHASNIFPLVPTEHVAPYWAAVGRQSSQLPSFKCSLRPERHLSLLATLYLEPAGSSDPVAMPWTSMVTDALTAQKRRHSPLHHDDSNFPGLRSRPLSLLAANTEKLLGTSRLGPSLRGLFWVHFSSALSCFRGRRGRRQASPHPLRIRVQQAAPAPCCGNHRPMGGPACSR